MLRRVLVPLALLGLLLAAAPAQAREVRVWMLKGEQYRPVKRDIQDLSSPGRVRALLRGPSETERTRGIKTLIPEGTTLEDVRRAATGVVTFDLSPEFTRVAKWERESGQANEAICARVQQVRTTALAKPSVKGAEVTVRGVPILCGTSDRSEDDRPAGGPPELAPLATAAPPAGGGVRSVQHKLATMRFLPAGYASGSWDYRTEQAVMAFQGWAGIQIDGVVGPQTRRALNRARKPRPSSSGPGRRVELYRDKGVVLLIRGGRVVRAIHTSTGGPGYTTPSGSYRIFRKELRSWSVPFKTWLPYAAYFNGGIAFHEYPEVPPYPASHGCARLPAPEAPILYDFVRIGTPVRVY